VEPEDGVTRERGPVRTVEIGSVPETDPEVAVEEAFRLHPSMPSLPEMPRRDPLEGMVPRMLESFPFVADPVRGVLSIAADDPALAREIDRAAPKAPSERRAAALRPFLRHPATPGRRGVKVALMGPVSLARALVDPNGRPLSEVAAAADAVARYVLKLAADATRLLPVRLDPPIGTDPPFDALVQLDEPGATDSLTAAEEGRFRDVSLVIRLGWKVAIHDCGARRGTGFVRLAEDVHYVSFDATHADVPLLSGAEEPGLLRERRIVWGVVPTDGRPPLPPAFGRDLLRRAESVLGDGPWRSEVWFSPACGLGALDRARAARVRGALAAIAAATA
jgi:hypothetical protein